MMCIVYLHVLCQLHVTLKNGGSGLDYVILLSDGKGWILITVDYGGGGGG